MVRFPFSDLSQTKLRPAVVLADAGRGDWILFQVTTERGLGSHDVRGYAGRMLSALGAMLRPRGRSAREIGQHVSIRE